MNPGELTDFAHKATNQIWHASDFESADNYHVIAVGRRFGAIHRAPKNLKLK